MLAKPGKILNNRGQPDWEAEQEEKTMNEAWTRHEQALIDAAERIEQAAKGA
jgi:hypothetical protein